LKKLKKEKEESERKLKRKGDNNAPRTQRSFVPRFGHSPRLGHTNQPTRVSPHVPGGRIRRPDGVPQTKKKRFCFVEPVKGEKGKNIDTRQRWGGKLQGARGGQKISPGPSKKTKCPCSSPRGDKERTHRETEKIKAQRGGERKTIVNLKTWKTTKGGEFLFVQKTPRFFLSGWGSRHLDPNTKNKKEKVGEDPQNP